MSLQEFIKKNKDKEAELRCGSCGNSLVHCGKYEIVKVGMGQGKRSEEGILCENCQKNNRKLVNVTRIFESPQTAIKNIANFRIADLDPKQQAGEIDKLAQFKKIEFESITNKEGTQVKDEKTIANKEALKEKDKNKED